MPRPFRFQPPALPSTTMPRPRLLERLAQRWDHRVVTIVAGPGFGKSHLLAAALEVGSDRRDVWLSCEPADESADQLAAGLAVALGMRHDADADALLDAVWARAPEEVCFVLDDVHEVPAGSTGAALLERLVSDLSANGHLVFASRDTIPVRLARQAAAGQLLRVTEADLVFDEAEVAEFAAVRGVEAGLLASTGGWPALAELTVSAGAELVPDYLWEEVLAGLGSDRAKLLAQFVVAGGGDDEVASELAARRLPLDELVTSIPLVQRSAHGWAVLHPLWAPVLRGLLSETEATDTRRTAAAVHARRGRYHVAADLLVEADAWEDLLELICAAEREPSGPPTGPLPPSAHVRPVTRADFGRWRAQLPPPLRQRPEAFFAEALDLQARAPADAAALFGRAAQGFRERGDTDKELAAISHDGLVRMWMNDIAGLLELFGRVGELAAAGWAHVLGDSAGVHSALAGLDEDADRGWHGRVCWLRSVAFRRAGELASARAALSSVVDRFGYLDPQVEIAELRIEWLEGGVVRVAERLAQLHAAYVESDSDFLAREAGLEAAGKLAWLGEPNRAADMLDASVRMLPEVSHPLARVLEAIARAAIAVARGDEVAAADVLAAEVVTGPSWLGSPSGWFWRDRAATALVYVLVPSTRPQWHSEALGPAHMPGLRLAQALVAAREDALERLRKMEWPDTGVIRAHLPARWVAELAAAADAAGNPTPEDLLDAVGLEAGAALRAVADRAAAAPVAAAARRLARAVPAVPPYRLSVGVLGPLELARDGAVAEPPELRRQRVRELLCYLVVHRRVRREAVADELWPDLDAPGPNLRVTLNYLQRALQPDRPPGQSPSFVTTRGEWLELSPGGCLDVDAWILDRRLDDAEIAERNGSVTSALAMYREVLPLWRGTPLADAPYAMWAEPERARITARYVDAAIRAGELWLAARDIDDAARAAERAVAAEPASERASRLLARTLLARDDRTGARRALECCALLLADLGVEPDESTANLLASVSGR